MIGSNQIKSASEGEIRMMAWRISINNQQK